MTFKKEKALNQWLDEQLKAGLIVKLKSRYAALAMCSSLSHLKHFLVSLSFFFEWHFFAICPYLLQLKHFSFPSLKFSLDFPMSIGCPCTPYVIPVLVL